MTGRPEREPALNIYDLAKHLGISSGTVSRALNNRPEVSAATRERVLEAAAKLGFSPSPLARGLARNQSQTIGVIVPTSDDPFFLSFARGVQSIFGASGYSVVLSFADAPDSIAGASKSFIASRAAGILLLGGSEVTDDKIAKIVGKTPVVVALRRAQHAEFSSVFVNHEDGASAMVRLLRERGSQHIAFVSLPLTSQAAHERLRGYRSAIDDVDPAWTVVARGGKPLDGVEATVELMSRPGSERIEAIFYASDALATGGLNSLFSKGIDVPKDIAVAGFGDIDSSAVTVPPLTTVRVPMYEVGCRAGSMLLEAIEDDPATTRDIELGLELIERDSTRN